MMVAKKMPMAEAVRRYVDELKAAAKAISVELARDADAAARSALAAAALPAAPAPKTPKAPAATPSVARIRRAPVVPRSALQPAIV